jgi:hypothetical protein
MLGHPFDPMHNMEQDLKRAEPIFAPKRLLIILKG